MTYADYGLAIPFGELSGGKRNLTVAFAAYAELGVRWVRTDFWWNEVQASAESGYEWSALDRVVAEARRHDIRILAELQGVPRWVAASGGMASSGNVAAYTRFVAAAAEHFKGRVPAWEIWNEPNLKGTWGAQPDAADYSRILKAAYKRIKAVDPEAFVIIGGLSPAPETASDHISAAEFLTQIYAAGAKDCFDAVGFHPYSWPLMPNDSAPWNGFRIMRTDIRATMVANGDAAKQVWMTEVGAPTKGGSRAVSEQQQAATLQQTIDFARITPWAGPLFWYSFQDRGGALNDTENWFGLIGPKGEPKPAYAVLRDDTARVRTTGAQAFERRAVAAASNPGEVTCR